jgi:acyl-coenzyme A thioesterase 7
MSSPVVARLMLPDDANLAGNVHGGTILQLMEQAGMISATRHFNAPTSGDIKGAYEGKQYAGLARIETMSFHQPMYVGEISSLCTELLFTSERSALVKVIVTAENAITSSTRTTNTGSLWYLSFVPQGKHEPYLVVPVPQVLPPAADDTRALADYRMAQKMYNSRKHTSNEDSTTCLEMEGCLCPKCRKDYQAPTSDHAKSPAESEQVLSQMVLPGDCGQSKIAFGGFVMKLMDTAAGCTAFRHARSNVVTVSISPMDFVSTIHLGDIVTIRARMAFGSAKSMEILVSAHVTSLTRQDHLVATGTFSFVALDEKHKVKGVPALKYTSEEEFSRAFESQTRYMTAKKERLAKKGTRRN